MASVGNNNTKPKPTILYHYTTQAGKNGIVNNEKINKSIKKKGKADVRHGEGVYLTELTPDTAKQVIAANNDDGKKLNETVAKFIKKGFIDYYIEVEIKEDKKSNLKECFDTQARLIAMNRNVWLYEKKDINLSDDCDSWEWGETNASKELIENDE